jgi:hypothetical protein
MSIVISCLIIALVILIVIVQKLCYEVGMKFAGHICVGLSMFMAAVALLNLFRE